jgi:hypothetical protein
MGQYRPDHKVTEKPDRYDDIDRQPLPAEMEAAVAAARQAGLWRLDERVLPGNAALTFPSCAVLGADTDAPLTGVHVAEKCSNRVDSGDMNEQ